MTRKMGLGKGLEALIPGQEETPEGTHLIMDIPTSRIVRNPRQPRSEIPAEELAELAESIRQHGILQPLVVRLDPHSSDYILIAGERRLEAARNLGLEKVPTILREADDRSQLILALVENIQREDLTPLEAAEAYRQLTDDLGFTQEEVAREVGKSRAAVTNTLRLLSLSPSVHQALSGGLISEGHARALLGLDLAPAQEAALQTVIRHELNVRQTEELVRKLSGSRPQRPVKKGSLPEVSALEQRLRDRLGTRVTLKHGRKGGTLTIHYYSNEELDTIVNQLMAGEST